MSENKPLKLYFDIKLAEYLSNEILKVYKKFNKNSFISIISDKINELELKDRNVLFANSLTQFLTGSYEKDIEILHNILGPENPNETGMFNNYFHLWPIGTYIEINGFKNIDVSLNFIEELTKRFTGEFAVRNLIMIDPDKCLKYFNKWSMSSNFHLRRLSSEGLRPKLPWAKKLDLYIDNPQPVFNILNNMKQDKIKFVQKSIANNINDYLKLNEKEAFKLLNNWAEIEDKNTFWILKHALRNYRKNKIQRGLSILSKSAKVNNIEINKY